MSYYLDAAAQNTCRTTSTNEFNSTNAWSTKDKKPIILDFKKSERRK